MGKNQPGSFPYCRFNKPKSECFLRGWAGTCDQQRCNSDHPIDGVRALRLENASLYYVRVYTSWYGKIREVFDRNDSSCDKDRLNQCSKTAEPLRARLFVNCCFDFGLVVHAARWHWRSFLTFQICATSRHIDSLFRKYGVVKRHFSIAIRSCVVRTITSYLHSDAEGVTDIFVRNG